MDRLERNLAAANVQLSLEDLREITDAAAKITIRGDRYPEHLQRRVGQ